MHSDAEHRPCTKMHFYALAMQANALRMRSRVLLVSRHLDATRLLVGVQLVVKGWCQGGNRGAVALAFDLPMQVHATKLALQHIATSSRRLAISGLQPAP